MSHTYDVVIIGAGINGVAIAKALSEKGKSVCVLEKSTIACGASSHSSRLIHGGLRYLEHFEFSLVREALKDQDYLLKNYPDLVKRVPFHLPHYTSSSRPAWMIRLGLFIYRFFAFYRKRAPFMAKKRFKEEFSAFTSENLSHVFSYYDAQTKDLELSQTIAQQAQEAGAHIKEQQNITNIIFNEREIRIELKDESIQCDTLINATGAWIDELNTKFRLPSRYKIEKLSGVHIVLEGLLVPEPLIFETQSQRIIFVLPQENDTLIGTTEHIELGLMDNVRVNEADISYLLREINIYLNKSLQRDDIISYFVGVRPIIKSKKSVSKMSREYKLDLHQHKDKRLLHVYGGKLTTFHSLSLKVCKHLF